MAERDADLEEEDTIGVDQIEDEDDLPPEEENPDEALGDDPPDEPEPPAKPLTRREREVIKLRKQRQDEQRENRELRERLARLEGQTETLARAPQPQQPAEDPAAEAARLEAMTPQEQVKYLLDKERRQIQAAFAQTNFQSADRADKTDFRILCKDNVAYASVAKEVEDELARMRRNGFTANREDIADKLLGKRAAAKAAKQTERAPARTKQTRSLGGRSDVASDTRERKKAPTTARERLEALEAKGVNPFNSRR